MSVYYSKIIILYYAKNNSVTVKIRYSPISKVFSVLGKRKCFKDLFAEVFVKICHSFYSKQSVENHIIWKNLNVYIFVKYCAKEH